MNTVEKLEAAIARLSELREESEGITWHHRPGDDTVEDETGYYIVDGTYPYNASLIVALHRSIDAQLKFLRDALTAALADERYFSYDYAVALADAILDGDS